MHQPWVLGMWEDLLYYHVCSAYGSYPGKCCCRSTVAKRVCKLWPCLAPCARTDPHKSVSKAATLYNKTRWSVAVATGHEG